MNFDQVDHVTLIGSGLGEIDFNAILTVSINETVHLDWVSIESPYEDVSINEFSWPLPLIEEPEEETR